MPKAQKGAGIDKYPGLKEFATRVYRQTPSGQHDALRVQLNHFVSQAKLSGDATQMNWALQSMNTLQAKYGSPREAPSAFQKLENSATISRSANAQEAPKSSVAQRKFKPTSNPLRASKPPRSSSNSRAARAGDPHERDRTNLSVLTTSSLDSRVSSPPAAEAQAKSAGVLSSSVFPPKGKSVADPAIVEASDRVPVYSAAGGKSGSQKSRKEQRKTADVAERRRARFGSPSANESPYMELKTNGPVVGTSQKLEKPYFRLTGQVNATVVRPPSVIERALEYVLEKYNQDRSNYAYVSDQLKSLRQDLTVQHIVSSLTVRVYECNARVSLEHDDLGEYNQCSAQLLTMYEQAREQLSKKESKVMLRNEKEFQAYVIYYKLYVGAWDELGILLRELDTEAPSTTPESGQSEPALMLRRAMDCVAVVMAGQNLKLFCYLKEASELERKLISKFAIRAQLRMLQAVTRATTQHNQQLPLSLLSQGLGLSGIDEICAFLDQWKIPRGDSFLDSAEALTAIAGALSSVSGPADIKGQI